MECEDVKGKIILTMEELESTAQPTDLFAQVNQEITQEREELVLDMITIREAEDWSFLANQLVGLDLHSNFA